MKRLTVKEGLAHMKNIKILLDSDVGELMMPNPYITEKVREE